MSRRPRHTPVWQGNAVPAAWTFGALFLDQAVLHAPYTFWSNRLAAT
jgi:hypothetical protein